MPTTKILFNKSRLAAEADTEEGWQRREREGGRNILHVTNSWRDNATIKREKKSSLKAKKKTRGEREMKMANLHLFAFSSFCPQCAKVSSPSLPPPRHLHFFSVSQAHSSFCLSSFWFRFVSFRPVPSFRSAGSSHDTFSTRMSPASWRHICIRGKCVSMCVLGVCARTVNAP